MNNTVVFKTSAYIFKDIQARSCVKIKFFPLEPAVPVHSIFMTCEKITSVSQGSQRDLHQSFQVFLIFSYDVKMNYQRD